jgi:hypothetical protein
MEKVTTGLLCIIIFVCACSHKKKAVSPLIKFTSFEISYTNGWTKGVCFRVDSNKIFLAPQSYDSVKYALLPDSTLRLIDTTLSWIVSDTTIKSKDDGCVDCPIVALQSVIGSDTISIRQVGNIHKIFWPVIRAVQYFIDNVHHSTIRAALFLRTQEMAFPPPPPLSNKRKFLPPKERTKSGR